MGDVVPAVVAATSAGPGAPRAVAAGAILLRVGKYFVEVPKAGYAWTRKTSPDFVKVGDLVSVQVQSLDEATQFGTGQLEQDPAIEGALLAIDNQTGQIRAMIGGFDFGRSKFNRARQAMRQMGSTFKPIVYTAAIDRGYTPVSVIDDAPVAFPAGPGQPLYSPQNYDRTYEGPITLRRALEQSRNVPTVKLLDGVGPAVVIDYARRFGFTNPMQPYLSLALGAAEATPLEATSAYTVFPRQGVHMTPYEVLRVLDRQGNVLEENRPRANDAIRADTAFVMTSLLRGVATRGTAASAVSLDWPVAGKTGTMDDYTDAWFIGFDPDITIGVWIGFDEKKSLGRGETGTTAALPIWIDVMKARLELRGRDPKPEFAAPGNIVVVSVDKASGVPSAGENTISETFIAGTQPTAVPLSDGLSAALGTRHSSTAPRHLGTRHAHVTVLLRRYLSIGCSPRSSMSMALRRAFGQGLRLLRRREPRDVLLAPGGRQRLEHRPRLRACLEGRLHLWRGDVGPVPEGHRDAGVSGRARRPSGVGDQPLGGQSRKAPQVHLRPGAARSAGRESLDPRLVVDPLHLPVDPAEAQRLFDGFDVGDAGLARVRLVVGQPDLASLTRGGARASGATACANACGRVDGNHERI